jgi:hypothetical protein
MKTISSVLISCYNTKEWIERWKRKQLLRRELNRMRPTLQLFKANGEFRLEKWKKFKVDYNVTSATIQVLLEALGEEFFSSAKQKCNKNKTMEQLSPYAKEFFQIFFEAKGRTQEARRLGVFHPYNDMDTKLGPWPPYRWNNATVNMKVGIIDLGCTPNWTSINESSRERPYFLEFVSTLHKQSEP